MRAVIKDNANERIEINTDNNFYSVFLKADGVEINLGSSYSSFDNAEKAIDRYYAVKKKKIQPITAFTHNYSEIHEIKITSIAENNSYSSGVYVWISDNGKRSKENAEYLYDVSDENKKNIDVIKNKLEEISKLKSEIENIKSGLIRINLNDLKKHFGD
jgi:hypothetical protein